MKRIARLPLILTVLAFILLLCEYVYIKLNGIELYYIVFFVIPFVTFCILTIIETFKKTKEASVTIAIFILVPIFIMTSAIGFFILSVSPTKVTNVILYKKAVNSIDKANSYFPKRIPKDAEKVDFEYSKMLFSKGLYLRYIANPKDIQKYTDEFSQKSYWVGTYTESKKGPLDISSFYTNKYGTSLPDDYQIYVIYYEPYYEDSWNHGTLGLAVISTLRNEVIFVYENW